MRIVVSEFVTLDSDGSCAATVSVAEHVMHMAVI